MSKKFYLISLLFYFCALFMSAQNSLRLLWGIERSVFFNGREK